VPKKLPKPYKEGSTWAFRLRRGDLDVYKNDFKTEAAARKELIDLLADPRMDDKPALMGPFKTSVAIGLSDYARERLPYLKGAAQEARRINRYLRAAHLPVICLEALEPETVAPVKAGMRGKKKPPKVYFKVSFKDEPEQTIPASLRDHRENLQREGAGSEALRRELARMPMADVGAHRMQAFVNAFIDEGFGASTVHLEVAVLRQLFNHARKIWRWSRPVTNPAAGLNLPELPDGRTRVMSEAEWRAISVALARYDNPYVLPLVALMLETAMRSGEPLTLLRWSHVDWLRNVVRLPDGKTGERGVPISPDAIRILRHLEGRCKKLDADGLVFPTTYEAVKKAWNTACDELGFVDLRLHDLRHTSATRYSFEFDGNISVLKVITGHKDPKMLARYVNVTPEQVSKLMSGEAFSEDETPAGLGSSVWDTALEAQGIAAPVIEARTNKRSEAQRQRRAKQAQPKMRAGAQQLTQVEQPVLSACNVIEVDFKKRAA